MTNNARHRRYVSGLLAFLCLLFATSLTAQERSGFDDIAAVAELDEIQAEIQSEDVTNAILADARSHAVRIETSAAECAADASEEKTRLEERLAPLENIDSELAGADLWDQRQAIKAELEEATARLARCSGLLDSARQLTAQIATISNTLSQQFLSSRTSTVVGLARDLPDRVPQFPSQIRESLELDLVEGLTPGELLWILIIAGTAAAALGLLARRRFSQWYEAAGGDEASPELKYLVPKPVAEFAPLWLESAALILVLDLAIVDASTDLIVLRVAWALFWFAVGCIVINWATGPLSPAAEIRGLIPDHVRPIRLRLRFVLLAICISYVVLGQEWAVVRISEPFVAGRAVSIFLVGFALFLALDYFRHVPGLRDRLKFLRYAAIAVIGIGIVAVLVGYQNLAAFLVYGVTRTGIALFLIWIVLWLTSMGLQYLLKQETTTADQIRSSLGLSGVGSRTGVGFMQLVVDLVVWILFAVYMLFVWDDTGTTLGQMYVDIFVGFQVGGMQLVPSKIIGGVLIFAGIIVIIGWLKRWIDRRWLQHIVLDRGSRDAIVTLIGYVGFVIALLVALQMAEVDLTGLAWISAALAFGIGFGMQEIASNFVSGLILLFERPVRAGDFVTIGDTQGFVRSIRIRATEIETLDNRNVLVPNSELVSGRVTNWVLRDTYGRVLVNVGVAYGSDVEKVRDILERVARDHQEVITDGSAPAPRALFMGFGDSSLDFELRVRVRHIERRYSILSDLNFAIDGAFREAGITIPFPQRDLHIITPSEQTLSKSAPSEPEQPAPPMRSPGVRSHTEMVESTRNVEDVWLAITDLEQLKQWLVRDGTVTTEVGGAFNLTMHDGYEIAGSVDVFVPPQRMRGVIAALGEEAPLPTGPIMFDLVLTPIDSGTKLTVTVSGIPDSEDWEEYYRLSVDRWQVALLELRKNVLGK